MLTGNKNLDIIILNNLDDKDMINFLRVNKYTMGLYNDQTFWLNRILTKFSILPLEVLNKCKGDRSWSQYYIDDLSKINSETYIYYIHRMRTDYIILTYKYGESPQYKLFDKFMPKWGI